MKIYKIKYIQNNSLKFSFVKANSKEEAQKELIDKLKSISNDDIVSINDINSKNNIIKIDFDFSKIVNFTKRNKKPISIVAVVLLLIVGGKFAYDSYKNSQYESYSEGDFEAQEDYKSSHNTETKSNKNTITQYQQKTEFDNNKIKNINNNLFAYPDLQEVETQGNIENGKKLINVCVGCHSLTSQGIKAPMDAILSSDAFSVNPPDLSLAGILYNEKFLINFIQDPAKYAQVKKHAMPPSASSAQDATDIVAYLKSIAPKEINNKDAFKIACGRCHSVKSDNLTQIGTYPNNDHELVNFKENLKRYQKNLINYKGKLPPDLSTIVKEKSSDYLEKFINNPKNQLPNTTMPRLGLTKESYMKIKSYLDEIGNKSYNLNKNLTTQQKYKKGLVYWNKKDHIKAKALFKEACDEGNMFACANLSVFYRLGFGGEKNHLEAVKYGKMACDKGIIRGCETIALAYLKGRGGIKQNIKKAQEFFKKRCEAKSNYCKFYNKIKDFNSNEEYNEYLKQKNKNNYQYNALDKSIKSDNSNILLTNNSIDTNNNSLNSSGVEKFSNNQISLDINWRQEGNWVRVDVDAKNLFGNAKGGISISFPNLKDKDYSIRLISKKGVESLKAYSSGSKIWHRGLKRAIYSNDLLVEGWDNHWRVGDINSISCKVYVKDLNNLSMNVRSVLIKNRQEYILPQNGTVDQQGYPVKQIVIRIKKNTIANNSKQENIKNKIKSFLLNFYKSGENSFPAKALKFYASNVTQYFGKRDVSKEQILEDKIRYYKKFPTRHYELKDFEIIETKVSNGIRSYEVNTAIDWSVTSAKGKTKTGSSYGLLTLIESDNGFLVKAIRTIGGKKSANKSSDSSYSENNHNGLYVCYNKKTVQSGNVVYIGCSQESSSCKNIGKYHFGKYPNIYKAKKALERCKYNKPKFVDKQGM